MWRLLSMCGGYLSPLLQEFYGIPGIKVQYL